MKRKRKLSLPKKSCYTCYFFTLEEFTEEDIKRCAEHWLDGENCPNWRPPDVYVKNKKIIWVESKNEQNR